jgi:uncharacterized protein YdaU (DUF1376 family)
MDPSKFPPIYKKKPLSEVKNRNTSNLDNNEKNQVDIILNKFFELFRNKYT